MIDNAVFTDTEKGGSTSDDRAMYCTVCLGADPEEDVLEAMVVCEMYWPHFTAEQKQRILVEVLQADESVKSFLVQPLQLSPAVCFRQACSFVLVEIR